MFSGPPLHSAKSGAIGDDSVVKSLRNLATLNATQSFAVNRISLPKFVQLKGCHFMDDRGNYDQTVNLRDDETHTILLALH